MPSKTSPNPWRYFGLGLEYAGAILVLGFVGHYLFDDDQGTPWGMVGGVLVAFVGATYNLIKTALKANREAFEDKTDPMTHATQIPSTFPIKRSIALLIGLGVVGAVAAVVCLKQINQQEQVSIALACGAICLAAALIALIPMGLLAAKGDQRIIQGAMIGLMGRLFGSVAGVALLIVAAGFDMRTTAWWALGWYIVFLVAEVLMMVQFLKPAKMSGPLNTTEQAAC